MTREQFLALVFISYFLTQLVLLVQRRKRNYRYFIIYLRGDNVFSNGDITIDFKIKTLSDAAKLQDIIAQQLDDKVLLINFIRLRNDNNRISRT